MDKGGDRREQKLPRDGCNLHPSGDEGDKPEDTVLLECRDGDSHVQLVGR